MGKRLTALLLVLVMVFSVTACNKDPKNVQDLVNLMGAKQVNSIDYVFEMDMGTSGSIGLKMTAANKTLNEGVIDLYVKFNLAGYTVEDYTYLSTMYVQNEEVYINLQSVLDFLGVVDEQFAAMTSMIALKQEYVKVTTDDLIAYYESMGLDASELGLDAIETTTVSEEDNKKAAQASTQFLGGFLGELADKSKLITLEGKKASFTLDKTNVKTLMDALAQMDVEKYLNDYATVLQTIPATAESAAQILSMTEGLNAGIAQAAASVNTDADTDVKFTLGFGLEEVTGEDSKKKENSFVDFSMSMTDEYSGTMSVVMTMDMSEDLASEYTLPENAMTIQELMEMLSNLGVM